MSLAPWDEYLEGVTGAGRRVSNVARILPAAFSLFYR